MQKPALYLCPTEIINEFTTFIIYDGDLETLRVTNRM